jgi:oxalate decarboxylase/phosphoglucose isomerase-like protein (cupin superfamily)
MHKILNFPKISDVRGNLTFLQSTQHVPFDIKRVFWIYDVPGGGSRGSHAYRSQEEIIVALSGSFDVLLTDQRGVEFKLSMNRAYEGLYIPKLTWRSIENFSTNSCALILSSSNFDRDDYIYSYEDFLNSKNGN